MAEPETTRVTENMPFTVSAALRKKLEPMEAELSVLLKMADAGMLITIDDAPPMVP